MAYKINFDDEHGDDPITSLQKLRARSLDIATIASCAPPNEKMGVRGCTQWGKCPFKFKGSGPQLVGMQRIYPTGERKDRIKACFAFVRQRERHLDQGDVWRVIAFEGEPFTWRLVEPTHVDAKGNKSGYREQIKTEFIPKWPEPEDHPRLRKILYAADAFKDMADRQLEEQQAEALANMTGQDPAFWMKREGPEAEVGGAGTHGLVPRSMVGGGDGGPDPGSGPEERKAPSTGQAKSG